MLGGIFRNLLTQPERQALIPEVWAVPQELF